MNPIKIINQLTGNYSMRILGSSVPELWPSVLIFDKQCVFSDHLFRFLQTRSFSKAPFLTPAPSKWFFYFGLLERIGGTDGTNVSLP